jgi:hypothetical protein
MRTSTMILCFAIAAVDISAQQGTPTENRPPKKGDTIIVEGCLRGGTLESTRTSTKDTTGTLDTALIYRLTGDKKILKKMREDHEGEVVEVTGELKSTLPVSDGRGTQIGRTRIYIGGTASRPGAPIQQSEVNRSIPVLQLKSYEGRAVKCG